MPLKVFMWINILPIPLPNSLGSGHRIDSAENSDSIDIAPDTQPTRPSTARTYNKQATTCIKTDSQDTPLGEASPYPYPPADPEVMDWHDDSNTTTSIPLALSTTICNPTAHS